MGCRGNNITVKNKKVVFPVTVTTGKQNLNDAFPS